MSDESTTPQGLIPSVWVDPEEIYPLIECSWYECSGRTIARLAKARALVKLYVAERRLVAIGVGVGVGLAGLVLGLLIGGLRGRG